MDNYTVEELNNIIDSYPALRENIEIQRSFLKLHSAYNNFICSSSEYELIQKEVPKIIWWCWLQGADNAPDICRACLDSVIKNYPECNVIILTEENIPELIDLPLYIIEKYQQGFITKAHYTDIVRTFLLCKYGGIWIDATVYCTGHEDYIFESPLFLYKHLLRGVYGIPASSWLIAAAPQHPILRLTRDLICSYWKNNDSILHYFLFHMLLLLAAERYADLWNEIPLFSNVPPQLLRYELGNRFNENRLEQIKRMSGIHKLSYRLPSNVFFKDTFYYYIVNANFEKDNNG